MTNNIQGNSHQAISWFLNRNYKPEGNAMIYLKWWKGRTYNQEYSTSKILLQIWWKIKSFPDKQKLREFSTTKPALQQMLKEFL